MARPTPAPSGSSAAALASWLAALVRENGGAISFERFMAEALYHPEFGYYTRHIDTVGGPRGDFATSATLSPILGTAIARWIESEAAALALQPPVHVIEVGGGDGSLLRDVIAALDDAGYAKRWLHRLLPSRRSRFRFHLVEISPRLRERQRETLRRNGRRVTWHDTIAPALAATGGTALIFSNELVDAFPVIALRRENAGTGSPAAWSEIHLTFTPETGLRETFLPLVEGRPKLDRDDFSVFASADESGWPAAGQRVEIHATYRDWLRSWTPLLQRGALLTIDYGAATAAEIYARRPGGSLRAYSRHQRLTGAEIYRVFGRQDLTADVCFGDLIHWAETLGWQTTAHQTQTEFLQSQAPDSCSSAPDLLDPDGAGTAFRVLSQRKAHAASDRQA